MKKKIVAIMACAMMLLSAGASAEMTAGTYTGEGQGIGGAVKVAVTVEGGAITAVEVVEHAETAGICDPAIEKIPAAIVAAQSLEPGSPEFNEVFDIAVRMYPDNPVANLNAANTAMSRGDYAAAEGYLAKAGDSPEATHARGALALMQGDYDRAQQLLESSLAAGIARSRGLLDQIGALREYQSLRNR